MALGTLQIAKNWFTKTTVQENNWDAIRNPLISWAKDINLAFQQTAKDAFGASYTIDNDGKPNLSLSLQDQINNIVAGSSALLGTTNATWTVHLGSAGRAVVDTAGLTASRTFTFPDLTGKVVTSTFANVLTNNLTVDSPTLFVDATNHRVGVGTITPSQKLSVVGGAIAIDSTQKLFLDGGGNTSIRESAADVLTAETGGTDRFSLASTGLGVVATNKIFLDGVAQSGDTYIQESAANVLSLVTGGVSVDVNSVLANFGARQVQSTIATGTAPLIVASITKVTNLNADLLDGLNTGNGNGDIPISNSVKCTNLNADLLDGLDSTAFSLNQTPTSSVPFGATNIGATDDGAAVDAASWVVNCGIGTWFFSLTFAHHFGLSLNAAASTATVFNLYNDTDASSINISVFSHAYTNPAADLTFTETRYITLSGFVTYGVAGNKTIKLKKTNGPSVGVTSRDVEAVRFVAFKIAN